MDVTVFFLLIVFHFIADFMLQIPTMALNKGHSNKWLTIHILAYMGGFIPVMLYLGFTFSFPVAILWWLINGILHWIVDYCTSRGNKWLLDNWGQMWFFKGIGFDQLLHYLILGGTFLLMF